MDIALSQITKLEGIATQANGNYRQFTELQDFVGAVRSIGTLEKNCTDALAAFDILQADADGKVIVFAKGVDGEVQFTARCCLPHGIGQHQNRAHAGENVCWRCAVAASVSYVH
ncbi:MAG: hypothetical protein JNN25_04010 [Candidatus Kapabacteria bacterium]|nr:hypothetical protein [Candidatus Kapabacteria bacterium]